MGIELGAGSSWPGGVSTGVLFVDKGGLPEAWQSPVYCLGQDVDVGRLRRRVEVIQVVGWLQAQLQGREAEEMMVG